MLSATPLTTMAVPFATIGLRAHMQVPTITQMQHKLNAMALQGQAVYTMD